MEKVLEFLRELAANNDREWFEVNKDRYNESRSKILFLTEVLIHEIRNFDPSIQQPEAKNCIFRIFRDVRFSNDKRPYKTNFGSYIARGGRKSNRAGYYFHIEPEGSFIGGGLYMPAADDLKAIRNHIIKFPENFIEILEDPEFKSALPEMFDHQLKTAPQGFPKDHPLIHLLRYRSFAFSAHVPDELLTGGKFIETAVSAFHQMHRVNQFLNEALEVAGEK
jgi:uncharacterized protein (TIGR02453 family)